MREHILIAVRMTIAITILTCAIYPLVVFGIAQTAFRDQANGSFVAYQGRVVGSALIGQTFSSERFFHSRPSAGNHDGAASGGTNLGPTSRTLRDAIASAVASFDVHANVPADAVTSSGSGLDPHISPANAFAQAPRVARANGMNEAAVQNLIRKHTEGRFLGIYGEPRVNVLLLNLDLARAR